MRIDYILTYNTDTIAPDEVQAIFSSLRDSGINLVCIPDSISLRKFSRSELEQLSQQIEEMLRLSEREL